PSGTSSIHFISFVCFSSPCSLNVPSCVPSKCFRKYSCPFAELPIRLARQTNKSLGKLIGLLGSSLAYSNSPDLICSTTIFDTSSFDFPFAILIEFLLNCG